PLVRKQGYEADLRSRTSVCSKENPTHPSKQGGVIRLDLLGTFYCMARNAYSNYSTPVANLTIERELLKYGDKANVIIYVDGSQCLEKSFTYMARSASRGKALEIARTNISELRRRVEEQRRVKKGMFLKTRKNIRKGFYWTSGNRLSFVDFMRSEGWDVRECEFEADVAIAADYMPNDVVITRDADFLAYRDPDAR
ncbi:hypothetical protein BGZ46_006024, partial [Entomortierella lignicola]